MKITNFKLLEVLGSSCLDYRYRASVDVTTRNFFGKKSTKEAIVFKNYGGYWYFSDTGKFTPGTQVEELVRIVEAKTGQKIHPSL